MSLPRRPGEIVPSRPFFPSEQFLGDSEVQYSAITTAAVFSPAITSA